MYVSAWQDWTQEEIDEYFGQAILDNRNVKEPEVEAAKAKSKESGGQLHLRLWTTIKTKVCTRVWNYYAPGNSIRLKCMTYNKKCVNTENYEFV